jgi:hypothetical protein
MFLCEERVGEEFITERDFFAEEFFGPESDHSVVVCGGINCRRRDGICGFGGSGFAGDLGVDFFGGFAEGGFDVADGGEVFAGTKRRSGMFFTFALFREGDAAFGENEGTEAGDDLEECAQVGRASFLLNL